MKINHEVHIQVADQDVTLLADKALLLPAEDVLVLSDLHLGKASHFQQYGLSVPGAVAKADLRKWDELVRRYTPAKVVIAGDLFHASINSEWNWFTSWIREWNHLEFHLVKGNHDRFPDSIYTDSGLIVHQTQYNLDSARIIHQPALKTGSKLEISGHVHPGIRIRGTGRQNIRLPCFIIRANQIILPAFGQFTGLDTGYACENDLVYAIAEQEIILFTS
ncbi:ligase-associated DNA damage response endonuclease PdeM [Membranicola marinus]|uniref:Ligase-associated DNA damage response endonuclease PdeM n=1 Tax=Membranihabitans marinus TaxID=1227546 RepID=A0A953HL05_9BACT|nr:ligase-associated DNA damage response endonuclease PdeM [Membranihabitans marinus]MBY5957004.1 ligase-associated DNA damage response endonuclease PdeM [Membranihabitans marinus]